MDDTSFDDLIASFRFTTRLKPPAREILEGLVMQLERLAVAASALGARPLPEPRARALAAAAECAHAVARLLPDLTEEQRPGWALAGAAATIEAIEACRAADPFAGFPAALDLLLIEARVRIDALAREMVGSA